MNYLSESTKHTGSQEVLTLFENWLDYSERSFVIKQQVLNASHMMQIL